ncbi:MAG: hypothetical protein KDD61_12955 [Bdellovibrionales bacterium]|nr:hypothetical protein [Bdellovibrionales bacterium]
MRTTIFAFILLGLLVLPYQNCASHDNSQGTEVDYSSIEMEAAAKAVLSTNCTSCHGTDAPAENKMSDIMNINMLIETGYIVPGNPQQSRLYLDVIDGIMPPEVSLSANDILALADWIRDIGEHPEDPTGGSIPELPTDGGATQPVTFTQIYGNIIAPKCTGCHGTNQASGGVRLNGHANVLTQVVPGNPGASQLYLSISTNDMPRNAGPLTALEKTAIFNWIQQGAKND